MLANTSYTSYAQHANTTITVTNTAELNAALANLGSSGGGTILVDGNGGPYNIFGNGVGDANNPVLIKALDPANQPLVQNIYLLNSSHISMTELHVDSSATNNTVQDLRISNSDHMEFVGNTMTSDANGFLDGSSAITKGADAALIRSSTDIVFSNNTLSDYNQGTTFLDIKGLDFSDNELTGFQGDGFRAGGLQDAVLSNNYMHNFNGSLQSLNHTDFIQIWSTNANLLTTNVQINDNILDTNGQASSQGIFIGNEGTRGAAQGAFYQDIRVFDNVVHTASWHGITVEGTQNAQIYDNAVLLDDQSFGKADPSSGWSQAEPWVMAANSPNALVYGNISGRVTVNGTNDLSAQNQLLDYNDPNTDLYVGNLMANLIWSPSGGAGSSTGGTIGVTSPSTTDPDTDTSAGDLPSTDTDLGEPQIKSIFSEFISSVTERFSAKSPDTPSSDTPDISLQDLIDMFEQGHVQTVSQDEDENDDSLLMEYL